MFLLNGTHFNVLERSLDTATLRQKVIANNVANVDTPNFKKSEVRFEEYLQQQLDSSDSSLTGYRTNPRHFPIGRESLSLQPVVVQDGQSAMNNNQNNVDIDYEMSLMAKNQLRYNALIEQVNHEIKQLRTAIDGRR